MLLWWIVVGPELSWAKIAHGQTLKWIGAQVTILSAVTFSVSLPDDYARELVDEALRMLNMKAVPLVDVRKFSGRCSWAAGIVPGLGAMISPMWAAIADCVAARTTDKRTCQQHGLVPTIRIAMALRWVVAFMKGRAGTLTWVFDARVHKARARIPMEFDASPWGTGGFCS